MNVGLVGNNDGPLALLRALHDAGREAACVGLQQPAAPDLRARYERRARCYFEDFGEERLLERLAPLDLDVLVNCFCTFRFRRLLEQNFDVLNVHLAPLPRYRGRHPVQWALINGEERFGVTIHRMTEAWDAGALLWQERVQVAPGTSVRALRRQLLDAVEADFAPFLDRYAAGDIESRPNDDAEATYVARRRPSDSRLTDWSDRDAVVRKVMALRSEDYPAFCEIGGARLVTRHAEAGPRRYAGLAAPFVCAVGAETIEVACMDGRTVVLGALEPTAPPVRINQRVDRVGG